MAGVINEVVVTFTGQTSGVSVSAVATCTMLGEQITFKLEQGEMTLTTQSLRDAHDATVAIREQIYVQLEAFRLERPPAP